MNAGSIESRRFSLSIIGENATECYTKIIWYYLDVLGIPEMLYSIKGFQELLFGRKT